MTSKERVQLLEEILAIDTTNKNEGKVADLLAKYLKRAGIASKKVQYAPGRSNLVAEYGKEGPVFGLSGHMDVVPSGEKHLWKNDPFTPEERDGKIYARGATDMKSGLAAMVAAMVELAEEKENLNGKIRLLATVGEETGLMGARQLTDLGYADDLQALVIGEPTGHRIVYAHKGVMTYTVTSYGKSAHSSMPELGINAIDNLLLFYNQMMDEFRKLDDIPNPVLGKTIFCNSVISGGEQFNIVPDKAVLTANLRTVPEADNEMVKAILEGIVDDLNVNMEDMKLELEISQSNLPMFSSPDSRLVQTALAVSQAAFGEKPEILGAPGATDAAEFIRGNRDMQVIVFGPGNETMHQRDEFVDTQNYLEMIDVYKEIIRNYLDSSDVAGAPMGEVTKAAVEAVMSDEAGKETKYKKRKTALLT